MADQDPHPLPAASAPRRPGRPKHGLCANQPNGGPFLPNRPETLARPTRAMADLSTRWDNGKTLDVSFLNGDDSWGQVVRDAVRRLAPTWSNYANLKFDFDQPSAHIAVNLVPSVSTPYGTYSCYLGTDCLARFRQGIPSMNLVFDPALDDYADFREQEFQRVILHEFGHALGLIHEHMRPDRPMTWDEDALLQAFGPGTPCNWPVEMIRSQIENFYSVGVTAGTGFDLTSIMMYEFPAGMAFYSDGSPFQTPNNTALSPMDKVLANLIYPATGVARPDEVALVPGDPPVPGSIQAPGQVARYRFHAAAAGLYDITAGGDTPVLLSVLARRGDPAGSLLANEGAGVSVSFPAIDANKDYFIEVRHATPMTGTGPFSISIRRKQ
jgi:hypothetical protein